MHFYIILSLFVFRRKCVSIDNVALIIFSFFLYALVLVLFLECCVSQY